MKRPNIWLRYQLLKQSVLQTFLKAAHPKAIYLSRKIKWTNNIPIISTFVMAEEFRDRFGNPDETNATAKSDLAEIWIPILMTSEDAQNCWPSIEYILRRFEPPNSIMRFDPRKLAQTLSRIKTKDGGSSWGRLGLLDFKSAYGSRKSDWKLVSIQHALFGGDHVIFMFVAIPSEHLRRDLAEIGNADIESEVDFHPKTILGTLKGRFGFGTKSSNRLRLNKLQKRLEASKSQIMSVLDSYGIRQSIDYFKESGVQVWIKNEKSSGSQSKAVVSNSASGKGPRKSRRTLPRRAWEDFMPLDYVSEVFKDSGDRYYLVIPAGYGASDDYLIWANTSKFKAKSGFSSLRSQIIHSLEYSLIGFIPYHTLRKATHSIWGRLRFLERSVRVGSFFRTLNGSMKLARSINAIVFQTRRLERDLPPGEWKITRRLQGFPINLREYPPYTQKPEKIDLLEGSESAFRQTAKQIIDAGSQTLETLGKEITVGSIALATRLQWVAILVASASLAISILVLTSKNNLL